MMLAVVMPTLMLLGVAGGRGRLKRADVVDVRSERIMEQ
jgi:hypothetical protein